VRTARQRREKKKRQVLSLDHPFWFYYYYFSFCSFWFRFVSFDFLQLIPRELASVTHAWHGWPKICFMDKNGRWEREIKKKKRVAAIISSTCHIVLTTHGHHSQDFSKEVFNFVSRQKHCRADLGLIGCVRFPRT